MGNAVAPPKYPVSTVSTACSSRTNPYKEDGGLDQIGRREERQTGVARTRSRPGQCLEALERVCRPSQTEVEQRERVRGFRRRQSETMR